MMIVGSLLPGASEAVNQEVVAEKLCIASITTTKTTAVATTIPQHSSHPNATTSKSNPAISSNGKLGAEEVWEIHGLALQKLWHWKSDAN